jgi:hypothetical protein
MQSMVLALLELHSAGLEEKWAMKARELAEPLPWNSFMTRKVGCFILLGSDHEKAFAQAAGNPR